VCDLKIGVDDVCAIMTTFDPEPSIFDRVSEISDQVGHLILVNDSGSGKVKNSLNDWLPSSEQITLIHNSENVGIARSLNTGIKQAKELGYSWLLTLDDDSKLNKDLVLKLLQSYKNSLTQHNVGLISLSRSDNQTISKSSIEIKRGVITSGSLFNINVFDMTGGFREELFIDLVDYEFCIQIRKLGYVVLKSSEFGMEHSVGDTTNIKFLGLNIKVFNHSPFRKYYIARNSIVLAKENFLTDPLFSAVLLFDVFSTFLKVMFFENEKITKFKFLSKGIFHGVLNKLGRLS